MPRCPCMPGTDAQDGEVLLDALRRIHPDSSTGTLRRMLTQGRVQVDGTTVHAAKAELSSGQRVEVVARVTAADEHPAPSKKQKGPKLDVLFEDETILVVNKPAGCFRSRRTRWRTTRFTAAAWPMSVPTTVSVWVHVVHR